jgi:hypothetical protein
MKDCLVYISGPITAKNGYSIEDNVAEALRVFLTLIKKDIPAYMPQMCASYPSCFDVPNSKWLELDLAMIDRCTHMMMLPRWRDSVGCVEEHVYAVRKGLLIAYALDVLIEEICAK